MREKPNWKSITPVFMRLQMFEIGNKLQMIKKTRTISKCCEKKKIMKEFPQH